MAEGKGQKGGSCGREPEAAGRRGPVLKQPGGVHVASPVPFPPAPEAVEALMAQRRAPGTGRRRAGEWGGWVDQRGSKGPHQPSRSWRSRDQEEEPSQRRRRVDGVRQGVAPGHSHTVHVGHHEVAEALRRYWAPWPRQLQLVAGGWRWPQQQCLAAAQVDADRGLCRSKRTSAKATE